MKLLRHLIARLNSWVRFPEFERLDDLYDVWDDDDMPRSIDGEAIDFRNAQTYDREKDGL